jgi:3-dehydroquinate dehydratase-2
MLIIYMFSGPNLNWLGKRNPLHYGEQTYDALVTHMQSLAVANDVQLKVLQTNHEGVLIDALQDAFVKGGLGIILNPGAWTHYAYSLHDTLDMRTIPVVEVHLSKIQQREPWRTVSVIEPVVDARRMGEGWQSYEQAFHWLIETNKTSTEKG